MHEIYDWVEEQQEKRREEFYRLLQRGREIWTPRHIFDKCCVKWLINGHEYGGFYDDDLFDSPSGCNGCNRDHPHITLRFDRNTKSTIAHLSHRLSPFLKYMNGLVAEGKAWPHSDSEYHINGYLRENLTLFRSHGGFGGHLVKVEDAEIDASDAVQLAELDEQEMNSKAAKRSRRAEEGEEEDLCMENLLFAAMDIVMLHMDVLNDPLTLFCLTQVSKSFKKFAESVVSAKVKTLDITVTPLVHGKQIYGNESCGYDSETCDAPDELFNFVEYTKREKILLNFQPSETGDSGYEPTNADAATFSWDTGKLDREPDDEKSNEYAIYSEEDTYCGQMLRVYWHPKDSDPIKSPERTDIYGQRIPSLGCCIAEFPLSSRYNAGIMTESDCGVTVSFDVLESNVSETEEVVDEEEISEYEYETDEEADVIESNVSETEEVVKEEEEEISEYETDEESENRMRRVVKIVKTMKNYIQFSGRIKLLSVKVDFSVIVRLHASQMMRELSRKYGRIMKERPLTTTESEYYKFLEFAYKQGRDRETRVF